jgi:sigma-B regulation protein RsbU (phosphoserine phosphatase)
MFVTVWLGLLELSTGKRACVNAVCEYPVIRHPGRAFQHFWDKRVLVAGAMGIAKYREYEFTLVQDQNCLSIRMI